MSNTRLKTSVRITGVANATHVTIEVFYSKGGMNYSTYKTEPGGYYAAVRPVTIEERPTGFTSESFMMFDDRAFKIHLLDANRFNRKTLAKLAEKILPNAPSIVGLPKEDAAAAIRCFAA